MSSEAGSRFFLAGGAGFIGSHFTDRLLCDNSVEAVTLYDNFSSGREWHYAHHEHDPRLRVIRGDVKDHGRRSNAPWTATTSSFTWRRIRTSRARPSSRTSIFAKAPS